MKIVDNDKLIEGRYYLTYNPSLLDRVIPKFIGIFKVTQIFDAKFISEYYVIDLYLKIDHLKGPVESSVLKRLWYIGADYATFELTDDEVLEHLVLETI